MQFIVPNPYRYQIKAALQLFTIIYFTRPRKRFMEMFLHSVERTQTFCTGKEDHKLIFFLRQILLSLSIIENLLLNNSLYPRPRFLVNCVGFTDF